MIKRLLSLNMVCNIYGIWQSEMGDVCQYLKGHIQHHMIFIFVVLLKVGAFNSFVFCFGPKQGQGFKLSVAPL